MIMINISRLVIGTMLFMDTYSAVSVCKDSKPTNATFTAHHGAYVPDGRLSLAMMAPRPLSITPGIIDIVLGILNLLSPVRFLHC